MSTLWEAEPMPDEMAMAQLAYTRWERAQAESLAEYISRRRTVDLAVLARQVIDRELTDRERRAIELRYAEELSPLEISKRLGIHKGTITHTLQRAEDRVRQFLGYVVQYQHNLLHLTLQPLDVRKALVVSGARYDGKKTLAARLRALRIRDNLSEQSVADGAGIPLERLQALEGGLESPDAGELLRLSSFYDVCADTILKGESVCRH